MEEIKLHDYGRFDFVLRKKGYVTPFNLVATVVEIDGKYILLRDNDDIVYLPKRSDIKSFEPEVKQLIPS